MRMRAVGSERARVAACCGGGRGGAAAAGGGAGSPGSFSLPSPAPSLSLPLAAAAHRLAAGEELDGDLLVGPHVAPQDHHPERPRPQPPQAVVVGDGPKVVAAVDARGGRLLLRVRVRQARAAAAGRGWGGGATWGSGCGATLPAAWLQRPPNRNLIGGRPNLPWVGGPHPIRSGQARRCPTGSSPPCAAAHLRICSSAFGITVLCITPRRPRPKLARGTVPLQPEPLARVRCPSSGVEKGQWVGNPGAGPACRPGHVQAEAIQGLCASKRSGNARAWAPAV